MATKTEVLKALRRAVKQAGSQRAFAAAAGVSQAYVSDVLKRRREPGEKILDALGFRRVVEIVRE